MSGNGLRLRVLGPVGLGDYESAALSGRLRRLLAALVVAGGSVVSVDRLVDTVWGDDLPEDPEAALHSLVARLRGRFRDAAGDAHPSSVSLLTRSPGYALQMSDGALDAAQFAALVGAARQLLPDQPNQAEEILTEALGLWRGPAYAEFADEDFAHPEAVRLEELRLGAEEARLEAMLLRGHHAGAAAQLEALVAREPLRERPHRQLMIAHYRSGRQADALAVSRAFRERLVEELGLDPSPELQRLEAQVLRQDPDLTWNEGTPAGDSSPVSGRRPSPTQPRDPAAGGLFGRDEELGDLLEAIQAGRLVTLTGPGGVGKTSLAREAASRLETRFADGHVLVELAAVTSPDDVTAAVTTALQLPPRADAPPIDRVVQHLVGQHRLLVLDNCEHVLDGVALLAEAVLRGCPDVAVLATSRAPLEVAAEHVWAVPTLPEAPAVQLFVERATARSRSFALDDGNAPDVAEICRRLDGLPLALELAAARMGAMSPADLVKLLSWRFRLLHGGSRTQERHRTLRAVVDWSYDMLDRPTQDAFKTLSVFAGSFTLAEADQLLASTTDDQSPLEGAGTVLSLVDRSMIAVAAHRTVTRYVLLETIRAYGRERLDADERAVDVRRAHAALFTALAEAADRQLFQAGHLAAVERIGAAFDELRAAWDWALEHDLDLAVRLVGSLGVYVEHRLPAEVAVWADRTIAAADRLDPADRPELAAVLSVAGAAARFGGDLVLARELIERGLDLAPEPATEGYLRYVLAEISLFQGEFAQVDAQVDKIGSLGPTVTAAPMVETMLALSAAYRGEIDRAKALAERVYQAARGDPEDPLLGWKTYVLAEISIDSDPERARLLLLSALHEGRRVDDRYLTGVASVAAAALHSRHGSVVEAVPLFLEVIDHWRALGDWLHQWTTIRNVVNLLVRSGRFDDAALLHAAMSVRTDVSPIFGDDAERMATAATRLDAELGTEVLARLRLRGSHLSDAEVLSVARSALSALTGQASDRSLAAG